MLETPDKLFTVAIHDDARNQRQWHSGDCPAVLLFVSRSNDPEILDPATQHLILHDPVLQELIPGTHMLSREEFASGEDATYVGWKLHTDVGSELLELLERADKHTTAVVHTPENGIQEINLHDVYYSCLLPQKSILGCRRCYEEEEDNPKDCIFKRLRSSEITAADLISKLKNRKTKIGGFTYLSPRLTLAEDFGNTFRPSGWHDFGVIDYKSEQISKGRKEQTRFRRFEKEACSQCFVRETCHDQRSRDTRRWCDGPYPKTAGDATVEILRRVHIPFTDEELAFLLANSYKLNKRYRRCIYWTTFGIGWKNPRGSSLLFGVHRHTLPWKDIEFFDNFTEAEAFILEYGEDHTPTLELPINPELKAVLIELARFYRSPTNRGKWRRTTYPLLGITQSYRDELRAHFYMEGQRRETWFRAEASTLEQVYSHWETFHYISQTEHKDRKIYGKY